uniref:Uncharacterized protein n=1 Tax=Arundo donax TaxID=35708 RepID=A0A0A9EEW3_ARUDO
MVFWTTALGTIIIISMQDHKLFMNDKVKNCEDILPQGFHLLLLLVYE